MNTQKERCPYRNLPADVANAIDAYHPNDLSDVLSDRYLSEVKALVAGVPPVSVDDARQMLSAATRFLSNECPDRDVIDVFEPSRVTRWAHSQLVDGCPPDRVRIYSAFLDRLYRVATGRKGRRARRVGVVSTAATYSLDDIDTIMSLLPNNERLVFAVCVGAGVAPNDFDAGRVDTDPAGPMWAVTLNGSRHRIADIMWSRIDHRWVASGCTWHQLVELLSVRGVRLEWQRCRDTFVRIVAEHNPCIDTLNAFGIGRQRLDRVVTSMGTPSQATAAQWLRASGWGSVNVTMDGSIRDSRKAPSMSSSRKQRQALAQAYATKHLVELSPSQSAAVEAFTPNGIDPDVWDAVADSHRAAMNRCGAVTESLFPQVMSIAAALLVWRHQQGVDTGVSESFTSASVEWFCEVGLAGKKHSTCDTYRGRLEHVIRAVNPTHVARPVYSTHGQRSIKACYTAAEERAIRRAVITHPAGVTRRKLSAAVALAAGAGLDTSDMRHLERRHITTSDNGIIITVPGNRPRVTVLRAVYDDMLRDGLTGLKPGQLVFGHTRERRNVLGNTLSDAVVFDDTPTIDISRLRSTWLAAHMQAGVPIHIILNAAGLKSARALTDLLPYLPDTTHTPTDVLRGVA